MKVLEKTFEMGLATFIFILMQSQGNKKIITNNSPNRFFFY